MPVLVCGFEKHLLRFLSEALCQLRSVTRVLCVFGERSRQVGHAADVAWGASYFADIVQNSAWFCVVSLVCSAARGSALALLRAFAGAQHFSRRRQATDRTFRPPPAIDFVLQHRNSRAPARTQQYVWRRR